MNLQWFVADERELEVHYTDFVHREIYTRNNWLFGFEERMMGK